MKKILLSIIFISLFGYAFARTSNQPLSATSNSQEVRFQPDDKIIFDRYIAYIADKTTLPTDQIIIETAKFFLGTPYVAQHIGV